MYSDGFNVQNEFYFGTYKVFGGKLVLEHDAERHGVYALAAVGPGSSLSFPSTGVLKCADPISTDCRAIMAINPTASNSLFTYPITGNAGNTVVIRIQLAVGATGAGNVTLSVNTDLGTRSAVVAVAVGDTTISGTIALLVGDTSVTAPSLTNTSTGVVLYLVGATVSLNAFTPSSFTSLLSESAQNFDLATANLTAVRPVAGYCWAKYRGKLTSNGSIAFALIDSAENPVKTRVYDYDTIAGLLHSYEGSITSGNYTIWCPMNPADTNFSDVYDERENAPYIAVGIDADDVDSQQVRLECYWVWEGLTQNQMLAPKPGSVDIGMMNDAFEKLAHFDKSMENDLHLKKIASFLKGTFRKGVGAIKGYLADPEHRRSIVNAAQHLLTLTGGVSPTVAAAAKMALAAANTLSN
jgi:hypothetical protein